MNAGLSNLATLKTWLLPNSLVAATTYDAQILAIGKGVASQLEKFCARKFIRTVGDTFDCNADIRQQVLPRYPLEAITKIEIRYSLTDGWVDQGVVNDLIWNLSEQAGLVTFPIRPGYKFARIRFTYTGGYFFETLEPTDSGYPTATPGGSFALPDDLSLAFKLQCEHIWQQDDKLGTLISKESGTSNALAEAKLLDITKELCRPFIRYAMM